MVCAVIAFWTIVLVEGYVLAADGTLVKREKELKVLAALQSAAAQGTEGLFLAMTEAEEAIKTAMAEAEETIWC